MSASRKAPYFRKSYRVESGTEDELSFPIRSPHTTPRRNVTKDLKDTPYGNLRNLAGLIQKPSTPLRRASSAVPTSVRRNTPAKQSLTPGAGRPLRPLHTKRGSPTTPHGIRALKQWRATALTPGRDRRKSGRIQRETPRDNLRNLSKVLARTTEPTGPSPTIAQANPAKLSNEEEDESDKQPDIPKPRFSLPMQDFQDDDDGFNTPPRISVLLEDKSQSQRSVEVPRRVVNEQSGSRLSRGSFGSVRTSDRFVDINELGLGSVSEDAPDRSVVNVTIERDVTALDGFAGDVDHGDTLDLRRAILENAPHEHSSPDDIQLQQPLDNGDDTTFAFDIPGIIPRRPPSSEVDLNDQIATRRGQYDESTLAAEHRGLKQAEVSKKRKAKVQKLSRHGIPYPSLPVGVVKKLASSLARTAGSSRAKVNKDALSAIMQASDLFLEQLSDDLSVYAKHAGRKTIDESDIITIMKRQRQLTATTTPFSLAQKHLPRELLQEIRMAPLTKSRQRTGRGSYLESSEDEDEDE